MRDKLKRVQEFENGLLIGSRHSQSGEPTHRLLHDAAKWHHAGWLILHRASGGCGSEHPIGAPCGAYFGVFASARSEEHTSELQSRFDLVCCLLLEKIKTQKYVVHSA